MRSDLEAPRHLRPGRASYAGSAVVHVAALVLAWLTQTGTTPPLEFEVVEINLFSPPSAAAAEVVQPAREELVVETPVSEPEPEETPEDEVPPPPEEPEPEPPPEEPEPEEPRPEEEPAAEPEPEAPAPDPELLPEEATTEDPAEDAEESGEDIDIRVAGVRRDYPEYYNNIIRQMRRCFRWRGQGNPTAVLQFVIEEDGTIPDRSIEVVQPSGNVEFDFEMMGTVECASGRLGPLPDGYPFPTLPIRFSFAPDAVRDRQDRDAEGPFPQYAKDPDVY